MLEDLDPFTATPRELLAAVAEAEPGPLTMSVLLMIDRSRLSAEDAVTFLRVAQRVGAWWESVQAEATIAAAAEHAVVTELLVTAPESDEVRLIRIEDAAREEVAAALRISPASAHERISLARLLGGPLRRTGAALSVGDITPAHARVMAEAARRLPGHAVALRAPALDTPADAEARAAFTAACGALQDRVLAVAAHATVSMTRRAAQRAVLALDAEGQERRRREALPTRDVWVSPDVDGMSVLIARMATERAHACLGAIDALARDPRFQPERSDPVGPRRADALTALLLRDGAERVPAPRLRAHLDLTIPLDTLLGVAGRARRAGGVRGGRGGRDARPSRGPRCGRDLPPPGHRPG